MRQDPAKLIEPAIEAELKFLALRLAEQLPAEREHGLKVLNHLGELARGFLYRDGNAAGGSVVRLAQRAPD